MIIPIWLFIVLIILAAPMAGLLTILFVIWLLEKVGYFKDDREGRRQ